MKSAILTIIAVIIVAVWLYYFYPKNQPVPQTPKKDVPAGHSAGWKSYDNPEFGFSFTYPPQYLKTQGADLNYNVGEFFAGAGENVVTISLPENLYPGTNFYDGFLTISVAQNVSEDFCKQAQIEGDGPVIVMAESKTINDLKFWRGKTGGATAGTLAENLVYHAFSGGHCYEISLNLFEGNIANFPEGSVSQFNKDDAYEKLEAILATFKAFPARNRQNTDEPNEPVACIQVITPARNIQTGEIKDFPTPCEVPEGWEAIR